MEPFGFWMEIGVDVGRLLMTGVSIVQKWLVHPVSAMYWMGGATAVGGEASVSNLQQGVDILDSFTSTLAAVLPRHQSLVGSVCWDGGRPFLVGLALGLLRRVAVKVLLPP